MYNLAAQSVGVSNQSSVSWQLHPYDDGQSFSPILQVHYDTRGTLLFDASSLHSSNEDRQEKDLFRLERSGL